MIVDILEQDTSYSHCIEFNVPAIQKESNTLCLDMALWRSLVQLRLTWVPIGNPQCQPSLQAWRTMLDWMDVFDLLPRVDAHLGSPAGSHLSSSAESHPHWTPVGLRHQPNYDFTSISILFIQNHIFSGHNDQTFRSS